MIPCTCHAPNPVNLSTTTAKKSLLTNLSRYGWSPITVALQEFPQPPTQEAILDYFVSSDDKSTTTTTRPAQCIYRAFESGAVGTVEPKESLEVKIADISATSYIDGDDDNRQEELLYTWCRALRSIAERVETSMGLPPNVLLDRTQQNSLDLMRAFYYHAVSDEKIARTSFGSSEHTDWGTLTVVWQDHVGGLQTYCHACQKYVHVAATKPAKNSDDSQKNEWNCIVHVGDTLSLALGQNRDNDKSRSGDRVVQWPSPTHRVLSQPQLRTSLVYFVYPPTSETLQTLHAKLKGWEESSRGMTLPLEKYYLLKNQSTGQSESPAAVLATMESRPLGQVFQEKWGQVQR
jgi:hypothetical protein